MYRLFKTLDAANSKGIIHRDMKGTNIIVNSENSEIRILDWGSTTFYYPGGKYMENVSNQYFRAPELMVGIYDY
jgi:casein kinase II subunit alpha